MSITVPSGVGVVQVLRMQEQRRSVNLEEIPMIDHVDDTILEEDESESSIVESESLTIPSIVITPILKKKEIFDEEEDRIYMRPPLAEPESLVLPSIETDRGIIKEGHQFEKDVFDPVIDEKNTKLAHPSKNQRIVAGIDFPIYSLQTVPETSFTCQGKVNGG